MSADLQLLARNAKIQLDVAVETLSYFRPRKGMEGSEAAIIRLSATAGSQYAAKIFDERVDSVTISRALANIKILENAGKEFLDQEKVEMAKTEARENWPDYLKMNASIFLAFEETKGRRRHPVLVLLDPEEVEIDGLLTAILFEKDIYSSFTTRETNGSWIKTVLDYDCKENVNHFLILTVTSDKSPIVVFHREIKEGRLVATDYILDNERRIIRRTAQIETEEWLEGQPNPETVDSSEEEIPEEPETETPLPPTEADETDEVSKSNETTPAAGKNGKVAVICDNCGNKHRIARRNAGQTRCKECDTGTYIKPIEA